MKKLKIITPSSYWCLGDSWFYFGKPIADYDNFLFDNLQRTFSGKVTGSLSTSINSKPKKYGVISNSKSYVL